MSERGALLRLQRDQLDRRLRKLRSLEFAPPAKGWIHVIRTALGMNATQLARRVGVTSQSIHEFESAEVSGAITIATMRKLGNALNCDVLVHLVPKQSLEAIVQAQADTVSVELGRADLNMKLEGQGTGELFRKRQMKELASDLVRNMDRRLWG